MSHARPTEVRARKMATVSGANVCVCACVCARRRVVGRGTDERHSPMREQSNGGGPRAVRDAGKTAAGCYGAANGARRVTGTKGETNRTRSVLSAFRGYQQLPMRSHYQRVNKHARSLIADCCSVFHNNIISQTIGQHIVAREKMSRTVVVVIPPY